MAHSQLRPADPRGGSAARPSLRPRLAAGWPAIRTRRINRSADPARPATREHLWTGL